MTDRRETSERPSSEKAETSWLFEEAIDAKTGIVPITAGEALVAGGALPGLSLEGSPNVKVTPKIGDALKYKGETLNVVGEHRDHLLLHKAGRNAHWETVFSAVTEAQLQNQYEKVRVKIDGTDRVLYAEKGHPERGLKCMFESPDGKLFLYPDHSTEVVPKVTFTEGAKLAETERTGKVPGARADEAFLREKPLPGDVKSGAGKFKDGQPAEERRRVIEGKEVKVRTSPDFGRREYEVNGKVIELNYQQGWFYSNRARNPPPEQVKLHVTGTGIADLARLHKELLPVLEELRTKGLIHVYKTMDPNFMDAEWQIHPEKAGVMPGSKNQHSKAFTIYVSAEKAQEVASTIDRVLKEKGLTLKDFKGDCAGEISRQKSESKRVSVERDHWTHTKTITGVEGALIDPALANRIHDRFSKSHGTDATGRLTVAGLQAAEKASGIAPGQITYDKEGRLMFADANIRSDRQTHNRYYVDESNSNKERGSLTGRPALYALYEMEGLDPAKIHIDNKLELAKTRPEKPLPTPDRLAGTDSTAKVDGTLDRKELRPGEGLARERIERDRVDPREIEALRRHAEELAKSDKELDRKNAEALKKTADALEGKFGEEAQRVAHRKVLANSQRALERTGHTAKAVAGGVIGIGILTGAALAYFRTFQGDLRDKPLARASRQAR